ncbi:MAG: CoA pyrophosphatase [Gammaproteobacteria bacterium]|nr:CoA pyrophosphatase [Gammaproteobacteria bacterium]MDH5275257.1 CoA pyrophosphatase [Gammaproteobacteria bacterium]
MIDPLITALKGSRPPENLSREAVARLPPDLAAQLFPAPLIPAAVLVALVAGEDGWEVLLTRRTDDLRDHPGQISFPGGRLKSCTESPLAAALRETQEEVGIAPEFIKVIGYLPPHAIVTGFAVSPVVAVLRPGFTLNADPREVAEIFRLPLTRLLDPASLVRSERVVRGVLVPVYACQFGPHNIWGATAQILKSLREALNETR